MFSEYASQKGVVCSTYTTWIGLLSGINWKATHWSNRLFHTVVIGSSLAHWSQHFASRDVFVCAVCNVYSSNACVATQCCLLWRYGDDPTRCRCFNLEWYHPRAALWSNFTVSHCNGWTKCIAKRASDVVCTCSDDLGWCDLVLWSGIGSFAPQSGRFRALATSFCTS